MIFEIIITFFGLIGILVLHEFGHFIIAKKFGVKVEEFGIGYPPRIFGKKIGETVYSLNWIPFGAFVKILGEEERIESVRSFLSKKIWQRALIAFGGVLSFWIMAAIILSVLVGFGVPQAVEDNTNGNLADPRVQITYITPGSPAAISGLEIGDTVKSLKISGYQTNVDKIKDVQDFIGIYKGEEIIFTIQREGNIIEVPVVSRALPPAGEGPTGIGLTRTAIVKYPWWMSPVKGIQATFNITVMIISGLAGALVNAIRGLPTGVQMIGPIGIGSIMVQAAQIGINYFLQILALIAIYLAISNSLPIPVADGGKLLFLLIEKIKSRPIKRETEQRINAVTFFLMIILMVFVTIKDIIRLF